jgi:CRISPR/Cas system-associated endonuclease Cas3-HD
MVVIAAASSVDRDPITDKVEIMKDEKPLDLRDKIAIEVLNGVISNSKENNDSISDLLYYMTYAINRPGDLSAQKTQEEAQKKFEKIIRNCYKIADIMRKVRLQVFD